MKVLTGSYHLTKLNKIKNPHTASEKADTENSGWLGGFAESKIASIQKVQEARNFEHIGDSDGEGIL
jgi:hypothetical protein